LAGDTPKRPLGRRRRNLHRAVLAAVVVLVAGTFVVWYAVQASRPDTYKTGEDHSDITRRLSRGVPAEAPDPQFVDVTDSAGLGGFRAFAGERSSQLPEDMGVGAAWGDYDGDGDDDLFLVSGGGPLTAPDDALARSELYTNLGDGTFSRDDSFPETRIRGMGAAWGDYDGDGDPDLVVSGYDALLLFLNDNGRMTLDERFVSRQGYWSGVSWSDFDRDGDLDLYVCGYVQYIPDVEGRERLSSQYGRKIPYTLNPSSYKPSPNLLFVNRGDGTFSEEAVARGVDNPAGRSLGGLWHDFNEDGWPDLYIANDISDNALYLNHDGQLKDSSHAAWVADYRGAMGLAAGDWNRDGDDDLFVTHWVAQENALYDSRRVDDGPEQPLHFVDRGAELGLGQIALRSVGWGSEFADFDSDGWLDLLVANGSTFEGEGEVPRLVPELPFLLWNDGKFFHDLAPFVETLSEPRVSRGLTVSDYDQDGDLDLLIVGLDPGPLLLRNDTVQGNWIQLRLRRNGHIEGSLVIADAGDAVHRRTVSGVSYLSQSSRRVHIGLGEADRLDSIEVRWPDGAVDTWSDLEAGRIWDVEQGGAAPSASRTSRAPLKVRSETGHPSELSREEFAEFWRRQRAAVRAMKVDMDRPKAIELFRSALELNPTHGDSLYFVANCLVDEGKLDEAMEHLSTLMKADPSSHRAFKRWGTLAAMNADSADEMDRAQDALERAVEINPEATGARMVLAETSIVRGDLEAGGQRLRWIQSTNPDAADALFLLGYVTWKKGDTAGAQELLRQAAKVGEEWLPEGAAAEGDTKTKMHRENTLLGSAYAVWNRTPDLDAAFAPVEKTVRRYQNM